MRRRHKKHEEISYWQSYSDMMAALLLLFVLLMAFTLLQSLQSYNEKLEEKERQIQIQQEQQAKLESQRELLEEQKEQLNLQQAKIDSLIGVKSKLIESLSEEFEDTKLKIIVDKQTGAITFDSNVLFGFNETVLKSEAKEFLNEFLPVYFSVLMQPEFAPYVSEIIIEGHTDKVGPYIRNLDLSQKRALSIINYCLSEETSILSKEEIENLRGC